MRFFSYSYVFVLFALCGSAQNQFSNFGNLMTHAGASVTLYGDFVNNGSVTDSASLINLKGTSAQKIGGTSATTFKNLQLSNTAGAYLTNSINISKELNITAGTFSSTGFDVKLISDQKGTARIAPITGDFAGNITMQRYLPPGTTGWRFLAAPVTGATLNDWQDNFITTGYPGATYPAFSFTSVYTYDESATGTLTNGYQPATSNTNPIFPGKGYWCYIGPVPLTVDVTGPPVKFQQTFSVSYTGGSGASNDGWVLLGNPYPSPIDWSSSSWTKSNVNNAVYIWNGNLQQYSTWIGGTGLNGGSNIIASSQGFYVQTNGINPVLSCNENVKSSNNQAYLKPISSTNIRFLIRGNSYSDESVLRFGAGFKSSFEADADARKLFSSNSAVPSITTLDSLGKDLSINSLPPINALSHIPVRTLVGASGVYTIGIDSSSVLPDEQCLIFEDLLTGIKINLAVAKTYTYYLSDTATAARFMLHMTAPHITRASDASCFTKKDGSALAIVDMPATWKYIWKDSTNAVIRTNITTQLSDTLKNLAPGSYSLQVMHVGGLCLNYNKSFYISSPPQIKAQFSLSADTIFSGSADSVIVHNHSLNASKYVWSFGDGRIDSSAHPKAQRYSSPGLYTINVEASEKFCSVSTTQTLLVQKAINTGLQAGVKEINFSVYPNPGHGLFYFKTAGNNVDGSIEVMDNSGRLIYSNQVSSFAFHIDLRHLSKGIYVYSLRYYTGEKVNGKLIIQ